MKYVKIIFIIVAVLSVGMLHAQSPIFVTPIEGTYGEDFIIVNYVDWDADSILDYNCGTKTYDGHQGTDFVISGFPQMDDGVNVMAVDSGVVVFIHDGEPDRNTDGNPELGLGNYIAIKHPDKYYSYYGHLKKYSILVTPGVSVLPGQNIGQIGSSGNSTDPHLHFELWYDSLYLVDPFAGSCGNNYSFWIDAIPYDTSFNVWESGLTDYVPPIDSLRKRPAPRITFSNQDSVITFWNLQYGLKQGDSTRIEWITPNGIKWFEYSYTYQKDWWFYYYYSYILTPPDTELGEWTYNYYFNDNLVLTGHFTLCLPVNTPELENMPAPVYRRINQQRLAVELPEGLLAESVEIYSVSGKLLVKQTNLTHQDRFVLDIPPAQASGACYILVIRHKQSVWTYKIIP